MSILSVDEITQAEHYPKNSSKTVADLNVIQIYHYHQTFTLRNSQATYGCIFEIKVINYLLSESFGSTKQYIQVAGHDSLIYIVVSHVDRLDSPHAIFITNQGMFIETYEFDFWCRLLPTSVKPLGCFCGLSRMIKLSFFIPVTS